MRAFVFILIWFIVAFAVGLTKVGAKPRPIKTKPHIYILTPYHIYIIDTVKTKPKEIF